MHYQLRKCYSITFPFKWSCWRFVTLHDGSSCIKDCHLLADDLLEIVQIIVCCINEPPLILMWLSHCSCINILGMMCWQACFIFYPYWGWYGNYQQKILTIFCNCLYILMSVDSQPSASVLHFLQSAILQAICCMGYFTLIHSCPWTCDATQTSWTGTLFVCHTPSEASTVLPSPLFLS
jgi:hypothetical protein